MRTHYQNLKVPENASQRDIRTAFRRLCHQYHPDKAPGNTEAVRIMQIINDAYEVLSDPARRAEYDQRLRILRMMPGGSEQRTASSWERYAPPGQAPRPSGGGRPPQWPGTGSWRAPGGFDRGQGRRTTYAPPQPESFFGFLLQSFSGRGLLCAIWVMFMLFRMFDSPSRPSVPYPADLRSGEEKSGGDYYGRVPPRISRAAVSGLTGPGYVPGYAVLFKSGLSSLTIDNSGQDADVFLVLLAGPLPVRTCFIPGNRTFTLENISPGRYSVSYQDLTNQREFATAVFEMDQSQETEGVRFYKNALVLTPDGPRLARRRRFERRPADGSLNR